MLHHFLHRATAPLIICWIGLLSTATLVAESITENPTTGLTKYPDCVYLESEWNDGDSFSVRLTNGEEITVRLYEVDAIETKINNTTDARRLRAQRRYFGISDYGKEPQASITKAIELGEEATIFTQEALAGQPFTIYTSHADARGGANNKRIYAFVETADGASLAEKLVRNGLARAFGVYRRGPTGLHYQETEQRMADLEFLAAGSQKGIWAYTDWAALPKERLAERLEAIELQQALTLSREPQSPVNPNTADAQTLQRLNGIGPATARKIIGAREEKPFESIDDLQRVSGIGPATLDQLKDFISFD